MLEFCAATFAGDSVGDIRKVGKLENFVCIILHRIYWFLLCGIVIFLENIFGDIDARVCI